MQDMCARFLFVKDMNGDGAFTVSDVWLLFTQAYLLPSNTFVSLVNLFNGASEFFEIDCLTGQGLGGAIFSFVVWLMVFIVVADVIEKGN